MNEPLCYVVMRNGHIMPPGIYMHRVNAEATAAKEEGEVVPLCRWQSSPSPHDDAGADKPAGVPDAIKGYEQYPFAWHFGNIKVVLETMECTGKLPNGCPNCKGLDFCTKRDSLKQYAKMEQCWNFWMEDSHHG